MDVLILKTRPGVKKIVCEVILRPAVLVRDRREGGGASHASEAETGDETASVGLALDSILDELEPLEIPDLRQLAAV